MWNSRANAQLDPTSLMQIDSVDQSQEQRPSPNIVMEVLGLPHNAESLSLFVVLTLSGLDAH